MLHQNYRRGGARSNDTQCRSETKLGHYSDLICKSDICDAIYGLLVQLWHYVHIVRIRPVAYRLKNIKNYYAHIVYNIK